MDAVITEQAGAYHVNLPAFEGPLDLLLYLIRKHDLDIQDIPMARLTEEYLHYLDTMKALDIDLAGEFLVMAAELMHMKSQLLLPMMPTSEDEELQDPRAQLVQRLLEYQRFKEAAATLERRPLLDRDVYRQLVEIPEEQQYSGPAPLRDGNVYQLVDAFDKILKRIPAEAYHSVAVDRINVNQRIYEIIELVRHGRPVVLERLLPERITRYDVVVTFLALLEMARLRMISLFQTSADESIYVTGVMEMDPEATAAVAEVREDYR